ncbi:MAG: MmgE/PrpD family protein [Proteobacteria bacterium]|nr:MmgE/PrpD family protein [Burkholderiales bacterium]
MTDATSTTTLRLAQFVVDTKAAQIPAAVLHQGKRCIINLLGVSLHATQDPAFGMMCAVLGDEGGRRRASVLGTGLRTSLQHAAMANALLGHLDDYDDTFFPTVLHPSAPTIPAALAVAEARTRTDAISSSQPCSASKRAAGLPWRSSRCAMRRSGT